jgi:GTP-binding protein
MIIKSADFVLSAVTRAQWPTDDMPEVAFAGRSNVGKSSLINLLVNRHKLARASAEPGKTQTINFYRINDRFHLVDLPGYGFARVPSSIRAGFGPMVESYLKDRTQLRVVALLLDLRRDLSMQDEQMVSYLQHLQRPFVIVGTKADKLNKSQTVSQVRSICGQLGLSVEQIVLTSSQQRVGADLVWGRVATFL